jgi:hypothetical protein
MTSGTTTSRSDGGLSPPVKTVGHTKQRFAALPAAACRGVITCCNLVLALWDAVGNLQHDTSATCWLIRGETRARGDRKGGFRPGNASEVWRSGALSTRVLAWGKLGGDWRQDRRPHEHKFTKETATRCPRGNSVVHIVSRISMMTTF